MTNHGRPPTGRDPTLDANAWLAEQVTGCGASAWSLPPPHSPLPVPRRCAGATPMTRVAAALAETVLLPSKCAASRHSIAIAHHHAPHHRQIGGVRATTLLAGR